MVKKDTLMLLGIGGAVAGIIALTQTSQGREVIGAGTEKVTQIREYVKEGGLTILDRTSTFIKEIPTAIKDLIPPMPTFKFDEAGKWVYDSLTNRLRIAQPTLHIHLPDAKVETILYQKFLTTHLLNPTRTHIHQHYSTLFE